MSMMSKWFVYVLFTYFCSTADVKTLNCDSDICKYEGEGVYVLDRVVPLSSLKFLRFPNAQLILQREMVPNLKSIMINDKTDCACKHFHVPEDIKINIGGRMCPTSNQDSTENPTVEHFSETSIDMPKIPSSTSHPPSSSQSPELCGSNLCQSLKSALICLAVILFTVIVVMVIGMMKMRRKLQFQKRQNQEQQELQQLPSDQDSPHMQFSEFMNTTFA